MARRDVALSTQYQHKHGVHWATVYPETQGRRWTESGIYNGLQEVEWQAATVAGILGLNNKNQNIVHWLLSESAWSEMHGTSAETWVATKSAYSLMSITARDIAERGVYESLKMRRFHTYLGEKFPDALKAILAKLSSDDKMRLYSPDESGRTPLHEVFRAGTRPGQRQIAWFKPLIDAIGQLGHGDAVKNMVEAPDIQGKLFLHYFMMGSWRAQDVFSSFDGCLYAVKDGSMKTPFHYACETPHHAVEKLNLAVDALGVERVREVALITDNQDRNALQAVLRSRHQCPDIEETNQLGALMVVIKVLGNKFGDAANAVTSKGETALHYAFRSGSIRIIDAMIEAYNAAPELNLGEAMRAKNKAGKTPLDYAIGYGASNVIEAALKVANGSKISCDLTRYKKRLGQNQRPDKPNWLQLKSWADAIDLESGWVTVENSGAGAAAQGEPPLYTPGVFSAGGGAAARAGGSAGTPSGPSASGSK